MHITGIVFQAYVGICVVLIYFIYAHVVLKLAKVFVADKCGV